MTRVELLDALIAERFDNRWWKTPDPDFEAGDDELTTARRRRHLEADYTRLNADTRRPESGT